MTGMIVNCSWEQLYDVYNGHRTGTYSHILTRAVRVLREESFASAALSVLVAFRGR